MVSASRKSTVIEEWLYETISAIPSVTALGIDPPRVWANEAPVDVPLPVVVYQQISAVGVAALGMPPLAATYRYQWRIAAYGNDTTVIDSIAADIGLALREVRTERPTGESLECYEVVPDLPVLPPESGATPTVELGGELMVFVSWPLA